MAPATKKLPMLVSKNASIRGGSLNHMTAAMKYVTPKTEMIETRRPLTH